MRLALLALLCAATHAAAQTALYLVPHDAEASRDGAVRLAAHAGIDLAAAPLPWPGGRVQHFFARTGSTQENRDDLAPAPADETETSWPAREPGILVLGLDLEPALERIDAADFAAFIDRAVGSTPPEGRRALAGVQTVSFVRVESAKALVRVGGDRQPSPVATSKTGQTVEIRPLMDPTTLLPGSDLAVRLYAKIPGAAGGTLLATNTTTGEQVRATADGFAIANVPIAAAGRWRLEFHAAALNADAARDAEWVVHTATLTFDVHEEGDR